MRKILNISLVLVLVVVMVACSKKDEGTGNGAGNEKKIKIGVSMMTLQYPFFQDIRKGIEQEAKKQGVEIVSVNDASLNLQTQIAAIENFVAQGVDAIILNAVDPDGISVALNAAEERNIPVITVDMRPNSGAFATFIGSDNVLGGELAGKYALDFLSKQSGAKEVALLTNPLSTPAIERMDGFKKAIADNEEIKIVQEFGGASREDFMAAVEDILIAFPDVKLIYAYSAQGGLGAYDAIKAANKADSVSVIGFDATDEEQELIDEAGNYLGSVIQFPDQLGITSLQQAVEAASGKEIPSDIPVDVGLYTKDGIKRLSDF